MQPLPQARGWDPSASWEHPAIDEVASPAKGAPRPAREPEFWAGGMGSCAGGAGCLGAWPHGPTGLGPVSQGPPPPPWVGGGGFACSREPVRSARARALSTLGRRRPRPVDGFAGESAGQSTSGRANRRQVARLRSSPLENSAKWFWSKFAFNHLKRVREPDRMGAGLLEGIWGARRTRDRRYLWPCMATDEHGWTHMGVRGRMGASGCRAAAMARRLARTPALRAERRVRL